MMVVIKVLSGFLVGLIVPFVIYIRRQELKKYIKDFCKFVSGAEEDIPSGSGLQIPSNQSGSHRNSKKKIPSSTVSGAEEDIPSGSGLQIPSNQSGSHRKSKKKIPSPTDKFSTRSISVGSLKQTKTHVKAAQIGLQIPSNQSGSHRKSKKKILSSKGILQYPNVAFYQNKIPATPNDEYLDEILNNWFGNYGKLNKTSTYIQWLFPNRIPGSNDKAFIFTDQEAKIFRDTPELRDKVKISFALMLDFYGMFITSDDTFELRDNANERLKELNQVDNHHFMYITRILLCLKDFGHYDLIVTWMKFLYELIFIKDELSHAAFSFEAYWIKIFDDKDQTLILESY